MRSLKEVLALSGERKGTEEAVFESVTPGKPASALAAWPDDRCVLRFAMRVSTWKWSMPRDLGLKRRPGALIRGPVP